MVLLIRHHARVFWQVRRTMSGAKTLHINSLYHHMTQLWRIEHTHDSGKDVTKIVNVFQRKKWHVFDTYFGKCLPQVVTSTGRKCSCETLECNTANHWTYAKLKSEVFMKKTTLDKSCIFNVWNMVYDNTTLNRNNAFGV